MRHLYLQVYLAFLGGLLLFAALVTAVWWLLPDEPRDSRALNGFAVLVAERLPPDTSSLEQLQGAVTQLSELFATDVTLRAQDGTLLAAAGPALPVPSPDLGGSAFVRSGKQGPRFVLKLPDGRWLSVRARPRGPRLWFAWLGLLAITMAVVAYPVARRLTGRLTRLQLGVEALGAGRLSSRVAVEGRDEVARLAETFNRAAERIEKLVSAERTMLASASHELRSPLARMRMAVELLRSEDRPDLRARLAADIAELDALIDEMLLASRLKTIEHPERPEEIDLLALAAEEAAHAGAEASGEPVLVRGDVWLLRRLLRILLDNARRYGGGAAAGISVRLRDGRAVLQVADRGPGIPQGERERIFEPFYRLPGMPERGDGVGLGLALVRQIARRHGGEARCLPREGGGTVFEVALDPASPQG
jgi:signal transduction histidine kinase